MIDAYFRDIENLDVKFLTKEQEKTATRDELILANLKFVVKEAHKYKGMGLPLNDLVAEGNLGLIEAADKFDASKGYKFITFAVHYIKMRMRNALTKGNTPVKRSDAHVLKINAINKFVSKYKAENEGETPSVEIMVEALGISKKSIENALKYSVSGSVSLNQTIGDGEDTLEKIMNLDNDHVPAPDEELIKDDTKRHILSVISQLSEKEAYVIKQRFFENKSLDAVGRALGGITPAGIKAIQDRALKKMKHNFTY